MKCTCLNYNMGSRIDRWNTRLFPVVLRALKRGSKVNPKRIAQVVCAMKRLDDGDMGSPHGAHHFKTCAFHPSQRATVPLVDTVSSLSVQ